MTNGNKAFTIRRMFRKDMQLIEECYSSFDFLHFNPMKGEYIEQVLIQGQIWAVFDGENIAACSYMLPAEAGAFSQLNASWEIFDLLEDDPKNYLVAGYVWISDEYKEHPMFTAFGKLWNITAVRKGKKQVLHYIPAHIHFSMEELFSEGYLLYGLRGLDKLVPHYIFVKETGLEKTEYAITDVKSCSVKDTKEISKLCEHGYVGFGLDAEQNINFTHRR